MRTLSQLPSLFPESTIPVRRRALQLFPFRSESFFHLAVNLFFTIKIQYDFFPATLAFKRARRLVRRFPYILKPAGTFFSDFINHPLPSYALNNIPCNIPDPALYFLNAALSDTRAIVPFAFQCFSRHSPIAASGSDPDFLYNIHAVSLSEFFP